MFTQASFQAFSSSLSKVQKISIVGGITGVILALFGFFTLHTQANSTEAITLPDKYIEELGVIYVDVSGAVNHPGLYSLTYGERVAQAIDKAGGLRDDADVEYLTRVLNTAKKVTDGEKIYIPFYGERQNSSESEGTDVTKSSTISTIGNVSLNSASLDELMELDGIGEKKGQAIIDGRPYATVTDVESVIGAALYKSLELQLSI